MVRPDSRIWFPIASTVSTTAAVYTSPLLHMEQHPELIPAVAGVFGAVFFWLFEYATTYAMDYELFRKRFDFKRARFEGEWIEYYIERLNDEDILRYAYVRIRYTGKSGEPYLIKGNTYDISGHNYARWCSKVVKFDGNKGIIDYFYFGWFIAKDFSVRGMANFSFDDRTTYAVLPGRHSRDGGILNRFWNRIGRAPQATTFNSGTGYLVDSSADGVKQVPFHLVKITDEMVDTVIGSKPVDDLDAERCFIVNFHRKFGDRILKDRYLTLKDL